MKTKFIKISTLIFATILLFATCKKEETDPPVVPVVNDTVKNYAGSGSEGDLITFSINQSNKTYSIVNETTAVTDNGSYTIINDTNLNGVYKVNNGTKDFYAVELSDKVLAANFPTGNPLNNISFGVSSAINNTGNEGNIAGDYVFVVMDNDGLMNDPSIKEWGLITIKNDSSWIKKNYASNTGDGTVPKLSPELFTGSLPLTTGDETGKWQVNGTKNERLNVTVDGVSSQLTGFVYATANEASFVLDLGTGNGFLLGLKVTNSITFADIQGDYKYVNVWDNGVGAGNYSIDAVGNVSWYHDGTDGATSGNFKLNQCNNALKNVFYKKSALIDTAYYEDIYCIIVGDIIMHFSFDSSTGDFAQYGAGAKI